MAKGKYQEWLEPEGLLKIEGWARDGLTEEQIAHNMGIGYSTLQAWKNEHQDILDTLKRVDSFSSLILLNTSLSNFSPFIAKRKSAINKSLGLTSYSFLIFRYCRTDRLETVCCIYIILL